MPFSKIPGFIEPIPGPYEPELREEPEYSPIERAIRKAYPYDIPKMDPELRDLAMGFNPSTLPAVAGIWTSNIINKVARDFAPGYPRTGGKIHLHRLMQMLQEIPQSVMDRIRSFGISKERPPFPTGGGETATALGVYHPLGRRHTLKKGVPEAKFKAEGKDLPAQLMPEVQVQGLELGRTGQDVAESIIHELNAHAVLDAIRRKVGWRGAHQLQEVATKDPFYRKHLAKGVEEPFAEMIESLSPREYAEIVGPYLAPLKEAGVRFGPSLQAEKANIAKAMRRAQERMVKEKLSKEKIPEIPGLKYHGIQEIPGLPDQYVFTEGRTGSTFYTFDKSKKNLLNEINRIRKSFEAAE